MYKLVSALLLLGLAGCAQSPVSQAEPANPFANPSPDWWQKTPAIYCPVACTGAGSNLMKFQSGCPGSLDDAIKSFEELPRLYEDGVRLGCSVLYLVDFWEGGYERKGSYEPRSDLGGAAPFKKAIQTIHERGGRVILYMEAFIVSRNTDFGKQYGPLWGMMDPSGRYYGYPGTGDRFYLMYPGIKAGWQEYLSKRAAELVRDYGADGIFLDSYGCQSGWKDYHPDHAGGSETGAFDRGVIELASRLRNTIRTVKPETIVMTECDTQAGLRAVTDGGLDEAYDILRKWDWFPGDGHYRVFCSEFSLPVMEKILEQKAGLALNPWWLHDWPDAEDFEDMLETTMDLGKDRGKAVRRMRDFMRIYNTLYANGIRLQDEIDVEGLLRQTIPFTIDKITMSTDERTQKFHQAVRLAEEKYKTLDPAKAKLPRDHIRKLLGK